MERLPSVKRSKEEKKRQGERRDEVNEKPVSKTPASASEPLLQERPVSGDAASASLTASEPSLQERPESSGGAAIASMTVSGPATQERSESSGDPASASRTLRPSVQGSPESDTVHQYRESISLPALKLAEPSLEDPVERREPPTILLEDTRVPKMDSSVDTAEMESILDSNAESKEETDQQSGTEYMSMKVSSEKLNTSDAEKRSRGSSRLSLPVVHTGGRAVSPQSITIDFPSESEDSRNADVIIHIPKTDKEVKAVQVIDPVRKAMVSRNQAGPSKPIPPIVTCTESSPDEKSEPTTRVVYVTKSCVEEVLRQANTVSVLAAPVAEVRAPEDRPMGSRVTEEPVILDPGLLAPDMIPVYEIEEAVECDPESRLSPTDRCERDLASCLVNIVPSLKPYELAVGRALAVIYIILGLQLVVALGMVISILVIGVVNLITGK